MRKKFFGIGTHSMEIIDHRTIMIGAPPEAVYDYIHAMPVKFPTSRIFDMRFFLLFRIAFVDGLGSGVRAVFDGHYWTKMELKDAQPLAVGSSFGPFRLIAAERPKKYFFSIDSYFFRGETGYLLREENGRTELSFDTLSMRPGPGLWWRIVRPVHIALARLVLRNIGNGVAALKQEGTQSRR